MVGQILPQDPQCQRLVVLVFYPRLSHSPVPSKGWRLLRLVAAGSDATAGVGPGSWDGAQEVARIKPHPEPTDILLLHVHPSPNFWRPPDCPSPHSHAASLLSSRKTKAGRSGEPRVPKEQRGSRCPRGPRLRDPFLWDRAGSVARQYHGAGLSARGVSVQQLHCKELGSALTTNPCPNPLAHTFHCPLPCLGFPHNNPAGKGCFFMGFN